MEGEERRRKTVDSNKVDSNKMVVSHFSKLVCVKGRKNVTVYRLLLQGRYSKTHGKTFIAHLVVYSTRVLVFFCSVLFLFVRLFVVWTCSVTLQGRSALSPSSLCAYSLFLSFFLLSDILVSLGIRSKFQRQIPAQVYK